MALDVHVISHTHWDREWYHVYERFRQRLVAVIDELIDDPPKPRSTFLLDGQTIVLHDYLDVRPERADRLGELLRSGRLEAGPWYVLADELIPSGEALVRNLLAGRRVLDQMGVAAPPVLYCPDSFGHPAALPDIAAGFGCSVVVLWRGYGGPRWPAGDTARWRGRGGATVLLYHLSADGYELGASLPTEPQPVAERWARIRGELSPRATTGVVLLLNGADHHARQRRRDEAITALVTAAATDVVHDSSLETFGKALGERASIHRLPTVSGELRDSYGYAWALQGTFAARAAQKRANAAAERALLRSAEPWSALARLAGSPSRVALVDAAWRTLLRVHPHDTLCGCSLDEVAAAADVRLTAARAQADGLRDDAIADLLGYDADVSREHRESWRPVAVVRNEAARPRGGIVIFDLLEFLAHEPVGPGSAPVDVPLSPPGWSAPHLEGARGLQVLERRIGRDRIEAARHYPDNDIVAVWRVAAVVEPIPGYGLVALPLAEQRRKGSPRVRHPVRARGLSLSNGLIGIEVLRDGTVRVAGRSEIESLIALEDLVDRGDLYTPSLRGAARVARFVRAKIIHRGPLIGELLTRWKLVPANGPATSATITTLDVTLRLDAESPLVRISIAGVNRSTDHRLRIGVRTGVHATSVWADAAFGPISRHAIALSAEEQRIEAAPNTAPLHRYVSLFSERAGATVFSDGLAEYEAAADGTVFVTLVRAVGELSRSDLPERPGHAGWPVSTPGAQSLGPFAANLALLSHGPRGVESIDEIERAADDVLLPLAGATLRSALHTPEPTFGAELDGVGLAASAIKESADGGWLVLRCVNLGGQTQEGVWTVGRPLVEAALARLDETRLTSLPVDGPRVRFRAAPAEIITILVR